LGFEMAEYFPFMLSLSKHSELLAVNLPDATKENKKWGRAMTQHMLRMLKKTVLTLWVVAMFFITATIAWVSP